MDSTRRISIQVPEELYQRLGRCFEWGERNRALLRLIEWVCEKIEKHGKDALIIFLREDEFDKLVKMTKDE